MWCLIKGFSTPVQHRDRKDRVNELHEKPENLQKLIILVE